MPDTYKIIDPVSGEILGIVGSPDHRVTILAFSPDDTEVFYQTERPWQSQKDCGKPAEKFYFTKLRKRIICKFDLELGLFAVCCLQKKHVSVIQLLESCLAASF